MRKFFGKCVSVTLILSLALAYTAPAFADDDDLWGDYDASLPPPDPDPAPAYQAPTPVYEAPVYEAPAPTYEPPVQAPAYEPPAPDADFDAFGFDAPPVQESQPPQPPIYEQPPAEQPVYTAEPVPPQPAPEQPPYDAVTLDDLDNLPVTPRVDASSVGFVSVIRHNTEGYSEFQNAVIEGLQVSTEPGAEEDEVIVTCYFIFRDRPTSFFYDINRKDKKLVFEFIDTRTGSSPIAALEQAPLKEIVIEETQIDANKDIKGLTPEWHDMIRITFALEHLPVFSVSNEHNIISFTYKWTTNPEKIEQYLEPDRFPMVFWISGGALGGIGVGVLTYFLVKKDEKKKSDVLSTGDLPCRTCR